MNARSPVAAHAMQSYYIFDIEGMQQRPGHVLYSGPSSFTYGTVNAGICERSPWYRARTPSTRESVTFPRVCQQLQARL
jgi:hypothetical protein